MKKWLLAIFLYVLLCAVVLPAAITLVCQTRNSSEEERQKNQEPEEEETTETTQTVKLVQQHELPLVPLESQEKIDLGVLPENLEEYVQGVVSAEMPASFPIEALKAQAVAARTYGIRKILENNHQLNPDKIGQAYLTLQERKQKWGENFTLYEEKIHQAVTATSGEILVYEKEPILAVFHSESGGKTETAENVWQQEIPYLKSVEGYDENAPDFLSKKEISFQEWEKALKEKFPNSTIQPQEPIEIIERSQAGTVLKARIDNQTLTGRQIREMFGLRSANFTVEKTATGYCFTTKGYGHGAGLSQYGAQFMAEQGYHYRQILLHYYTGVTFYHL